MKTMNPASFDLKNHGKTIVAVQCNSHVPRLHPHSSQVHSLRSIQPAGCVAWCSASVRALARVGPRLIYPLHEAPLATGPGDAVSLALLMPSRTGSIAALPYLGEHACFAQQPPRLYDRPALLHACTSNRKDVLTVYREPSERLASLLRLLCSARTRWAPLWCKTLGLSRASPAALAADLCALLDRGGVPERLVRGSPIFTPFARYYARATEVVAWSESGDALRAALVRHGVLDPRAPPIPRAHVSAATGAEPDAALLQGLLGRLWPDDVRVATADEEGKLIRAA